MFFIRPEQTDEKREAMWILGAVHNFYDAAKDGPYPMPREI
jgi:hypothetical protein